MCAANNELQSFLKAMTYLSPWSAGRPDANIDQRIWLPCSRTSLAVTLPECVLFALQDSCIYFRPIMVIRCMYPRGYLVRDRTAACFDTGALVLGTCEEHLGYYS